jgi:hypothetical protein
MSLDTLLLIIVILILIGMIPTSPYSGSGAMGLGGCHGF